MHWNNELTHILGIHYPVIQAPMLGITTPEMVAAISEEGGLGSLPVGGLSPDLTLTLIRSVKALTRQPFAVNLFAYDAPPANVNEIAKMQEFLAGISKDNHLGVDYPLPGPGDIYSYKDQVEILAQEKVPVASFTFGILSDDIIHYFHEKGIVLVGTATCLREAILLQEKGIDIVCAQGAEAGGHRASFIHQHLPLIGSFSLIPQLADNLSVPVVAAGGIADGRAIRAALMLGASGVQVGSAFLASAESMAAPYHKEAIQNSRDHDFVITRSLTGRWARGIRNSLITAIENSGIAIPEYPYQNLLITPMRMRAQQDGNIAFSIMWGGQSANRAQQKKAAVIFRELVEEAEEVGREA